MPLLIVKSEKKKKRKKGRSVISRCECEMEQLLSIINYESVHCVKYRTGNFLVWKL